MPTIPKQTKCLALGCKNPKAKFGGYCLDHGGRDAYKAKPTEERKEFNSLYQTPMWKSLREGQLSKQPLCQSCLTLGHIRSANHVDHLFAWSDIGKTAFYLNIFQSLCPECHGNKSGLEKRGIYRYYHDDTHTDFNLTDYNRIIERFMQGRPIHVA
jgi:5-methylcytosine-specific restriction enzyme A